MLHLIIISLLFVLFLIIILKDFKYALYILMVLSLLLHKELFSFYRWDLLPIRIFMLSLIISVLIDVISQVVRSKTFAILITYLKQPVFGLLVVLWFIRFVSLINTRNLTASILVMGFFTGVLALAYVILFKVDLSYKALFSYFKFYIYSAFALTVLGYIQLGIYLTTGKIFGALWNIPNNIPRVGSTFWDVNHYGALLASLLPFLGVLIFVEKGVLKRLMHTIMFLSMTAALLLTSSRTAWIMAAVSLLVFAIVVFIKKFGVRGVGVFTLVLMLLLGGFSLEYSRKSSPLRAKVRQYFHYRLDSFDSHMLLLTGAYQIFEKYPVFGSGYGSFYEHFSRTAIAPVFFSRDPAALNTRVPAHTIWGELLAETGILGVATYVPLVLIILLTHLSAFNKGGKLNFIEEKTFTDRLLFAALFATIIGWLFAGIFYSYNSEFFWVVLLLGYMLAYSKTEKVSELYKTLLSYVANSKFVFGVVFTLAVFLIMFNLSANHLIPWDEAIYAKIAKNMVVKNEYLTQYWWPLKPWYEKPPLYMWLMSLCMHIFGFGSLAAKLPSALAGVGLVILVFLFAKKYWGKGAAFISALSLVTTTQFLYYSRMAMTDVTSSFFITLALVLYFFGKEKSKLWLFLLAGVSTGFAVMTKSVVGFLPFVVIFLYEVYLLLARKQKFSLSLIVGTYLPMVLLCLSLVAPWHIFMHQKFGQAFWKNYIGYHVLERATSEIEDKGQPFWWYLIVMKVSMRIWAPVLIVAFVGLFARMLYVFAKFISKSKRTKLLAKKSNILENLADTQDLSLVRRYLSNVGSVEIFMLLWFLVVFMFFSAASSKLVWYITPIYPVAALMVGKFCIDFYNLISGKIKFFSLDLVRVVILYVGSVFVLGYLFFNRSMVYTSNFTGSQARLLQLKDETFGSAQKLYVDRIELPLVLYYTDGPFQIIDFRGDVSERVPNVKYNERLVLLTKNGRYREDVIGMNYKPIVVKRDGDWVLWYFETEEARDKELLGKLNQQLIDSQKIIANECGCYTPVQIYQARINYFELTRSLQELEARIAQHQK